MAGLSDIEWTDATWNPVTGCTIISPGCTNCYAMRMAALLQAIGHPSYANVTRKSGNRHVWTGRVFLSEGALTVPLRWRSPRKIFVNTMSEAQWHVFQILTKRPERMQQIVKRHRLPALPNVWLGTSVESADYKDRIDLLRETPASVRFVSFEPLIAPIGKVNLKGIHWAIVGGESGPKARPMNTDWVDEIERQCRRDKVAFFFKQWGGKNKKAAGRTYRGRVWDEFPAQRQPATPFAI